MSVLEKELDDFLDMVKRNLSNYAVSLVKEKHYELYQEHQKLLVRMSRLEKELEEIKKKSDVIWEK